MRGSGAGVFRGEGRRDSGRVGGKRRRRLHQQQPLASRNNGPEMLASLIADAEVDVLGCSAARGNAEVHSVSGPHLSTSDALREPSFSGLKVCSAVSTARNASRGHFQGVRQVIRGDMEVTPAVGQVGPAQAQACAECSPRAAPGMGPRRTLAPGSGCVVPLLPALLGLLAHVGSRGSSVYLPGRAGR
ncbi:unnamed protein product [Rangifer tarandus platyrhynchus]|uniref:Uncharacterized protein n=1 Tax=Rangifer tarandus platyrhynchus TaxID=3082113 RepID=A0ABN8YKU2_RANTA|nr:unnamed protein product [Rangifer tarandus platyrhynchus]